MTVRLFQQICVVSAAAMALAGCETMQPVRASGGGAQPQVVAAPAPASAYGPGGCKYLPGPAPEPATSNTTNAVIGGAIGAVVGGVAGRSMSNRKSVGTRNGALLGAVAGALVGSQYNKMVGVSEQADGSVKLDIPGKILFGFNSADISPDFRSVLVSVSGTLREWCGLTATVVGHTDNVGSAAANRQLSLRRATSVINFLSTQGVNGGTLFAEGMGFDAPIASNATEDGRAQNRRVEIFIRPPAM